jgi:CRP-like cAMP-binding protein
MQKPSVSAPSAASQAAAAATPPPPPPPLPQARTATVKALTNGSLWVLDRRSFKAILKKSDTRSLIKILRGVEVLASLRISQLQRLADMLSEVRPP